MNSRHYVSMTLQYLDMAILATPTGAIRNKLTEANMALMEAHRMQQDEENEDDSR